MSRHSALFIAILILSCATMLWAQSPELPSGPMQAKVTTACAECHDTRIIMQQRLSKAAWVKEVDKMIKWGAVVDAGDHEGFVDYLSTNFSTEKDTYAAPRLAVGKKK